MLRHAEFTGRRRYRVQRTGLFRKRAVLVLQVEERGLHTWRCGGHPTTDWVTRWRDATVGDLTVDDYRREMTAA